MSTDKELLEWAAKAIVRPDDFASQHYMRGMLSTWNPLTDDGDALRLAVKLELTVSTWGDDIGIWIGDKDLSLLEPIVTDRLTATRRAIVRAAAAIGKEMP